MGREFKRGLRLLRVYALGVGYLSVVYLVMVAVALSPAYALQASSTQYSRVVQQAEMILAKAAARASVADAVAAAALVPTPAGLAVKALAVGLTVGVPLGLALWEVYYPQSALNTLKNAATLPAGYSNPVLGGTVFPASRFGTISGSSILLTYTPVSNCSVPNGPYGAASIPPYDQALFVLSGETFTASNGWASAQTEWFATPTSCLSGIVWRHLSGYDSTKLNYTPGGTPTQAQLSAYIQNLAANDPNGLDAHTADQGVGATAPAHEAGTQVVTITTNVDNSTHVVPAGSVPPGAVVVNVSVPAPINTTINNNTTNNNTATTTTTTITNPNGSVTTTSTDTQTSTSPCTTLGHQADTLGSILAKHQSAWKTSGLLSTLTALKGLVFAGSPPVISLPTHLFGTFTVDFGSSTWAFVFTVMQSIFLALAGLVSVRIVFGRG